MKKKMIIAAVFVAAFALAASATFARGYRFDPRHDNECCDQQEECCPEVDIKANSSARVYDDVRSSANSGKNYVSAGYSIFGHSEPSIETGKADARADVRNTVDGSLVDVDMPDRGTVKIEANSYAGIDNDVKSRANSGKNVIRSSRGDIDTGETFSDAYVDTKIVGSTVMVD